MEVHSISIGNYLYNNIVHTYCNYTLHIQMECYLLYLFTVLLYYNGAYTFKVNHINVDIVIVAVAVVVIVIVAGGAIPLMSTKSTLFASFIMFISIYLSQVSH